MVATCAVPHLKAPTGPRVNPAEAEPVKPTKEEKSSRLRLRSDFSRGLWLLPVSSRRPHLTDGEVRRDPDHSTTSLPPCRRERRGGPLSLPQPSGLDFEETVLTLRLPGSNSDPDPKHPSSSGPRASPRMRPSRPSMSCCSRSHVRMGGGGVRLMRRGGFGIGLIGFSSRAGRHMV
jgi:hypothetical protein